MSAGAPEFFLLWNNLYPVIIPFLESAGGNCQDAVITLGELAVTVKLVGALEGADVGK